MSFNNRPDRPAESQFYIRLVTETPIRKENVKKFFKAVERYAPSGSLAVYEVKDPHGNPASVPLVHRVVEVEGKRRSGLMAPKKVQEHQYEVPLTRNLVAEEIERVAMHLNTAFNEGNFLLETSSFDENCCLTEDEEEAYMDPEITQQIAEKLAERMHSQWMNERLDNGWRYGTSRSDEGKTHPLMKPWNQLAEQYRNIDYSLPQVFVDLLEEFGYTLIGYDELNELIEDASKTRKISR